MYRDGVQHLSSKHGEGREHKKFHHTRNFILLIQEDANEWRCKISQIKQGKSRGNVTKQQINDSVSHAHKLKTRISIIRPCTTTTTKKKNISGKRDCVQMWCHVTRQGYNLQNGYIPWIVKIHPKIHRYVGPWPSRDGHGWAHTER